MLDPYPEELEEPLEYPLPEWGTVFDEYFKKKENYTESKFINFSFIKTF